MPSIQQEEQYVEWEKSILERLKQLEDAVFNALKVQRNDTIAIANLDIVAEKLMNKIRKVCSFELKEDMTVETMRFKVQKALQENEIRWQMRLWKKLQKIDKKKIRQYRKVAVDVNQLRNEMNAAVSKARNIALRFSQVEKELAPMVQELNQAAGLAVREGQVVKK